MATISEEARRVVDAHLQVALVSIKDKAEKAGSAISSGSSKRKTMEDNQFISDFLPGTPPISALHELEAFKGTEETSRDIKRPRFSTPSMPSSDRKLRSPENRNLEQFDLIKHLKLQVDKQKQILLRLTEENNEVRAYRMINTRQKIYTDRLYPSCMSCFSCELQ